MMTYVSDRETVDAIATLLGTAEDWSPASDYLDAIADILSASGRPSVGSTPDNFRANFQSFYGRPVPEGWNGGLS